jgi:protein deglycase
MFKTAVLFAEGFEEIEGLTIVDVLRRGDIQVDIIGVQGSIVKGAHNIQIVTDIEFVDITSDNYKGIFLPGGSPGYINLGNNQQVVDFIKEMNAMDKIIGAICASPAVLAKSGILTGKNATIYPGLESEIQKGGGTYVDKPVVIDGKIITSKGPASSILFALTLIECLKDKKTADMVMKKLLADEIFKL